MANKSNELIGGAKKNKELIGLAVAAGTGAILEYIYVKAKGKKGTNANANANQNKQNPKSGKATIQNKKKTNQKQLDLVSPEPLHNPPGTRPHSSMSTNPGA